MTTLADLKRVPHREEGAELETFLADKLVRDLDWPDSVVEQFLFDHGNKPVFVEQYGHLELERVGWTLDELPASEFAQASAYRDWLDDYERDPAVWIAKRSPEERRRWAEAGTWITPPLLIDSSLLEPPGAGLHVLEGHTRIGILRGRLAACTAAPDETHAVFVGRAR